MNVMIFLPAALLASLAFSAAGNAADEKAQIGLTVDEAVRPVMEKRKIPGIAVGVTVAGRHYIFDYGVASKETGKPVDDSTLFEIGSISKTFTVTLASLAEVDRQLSLSDTTSKYLPSLQGTKFGDVSLLELATHTAGGFPLQLPDSVKSADQLMKYFADWKPTYPRGTYRTYANPSIGMFGFITAKAMGQDFTVLMEKRLLPALGLTSSYIEVPQASLAAYAQGYSKTGEPIRMATAILSPEAYGVKTTAADMIRFLEANMDVVKLDDRLRKAVTDTHTAYFKAGVMTQDLIWEQYAYPVALETLLAGNSQVMLKPMPVERISPPLKPRGDVLINKTGSTNGFGAYVAFVPEKQIGVVILANKNYPNEYRIRMAHKILTRLAMAAPQK